MAHSDYEEFLAQLDANGVRYLIVGAHAVAYHAQPRATKDIDIFHEASRDSAERILKAIRDFFGGADLGFSVADLTNLDIIVQLGVPPIRIDLLSGLSGISGFEGAWANRVDADYGSVPSHYLSLDDLISSKRAANRLQDRADVKVLTRIKARKK